jgi:polysaccharide biosynthesis protein PslF
MWTPTAVSSARSRALGGRERGTLKAYPLGWDALFGRQPHGRAIRNAGSTPLLSPSLGKARRETTVPSSAAVAAWRLPELRGRHRVTVTHGLLSTYPPTACGLATFTSSLAAALGAPGGAEGDDCRVVRVLDAPGERVPGVVAELVAGSQASRLGAADALNDTDVVIIQHEYGIFGGRDGEEILAVLDDLIVPVIVVLHTVLLEPTMHQREVLEAVVAAADAVVTMTHGARRRLAAGYDADLTKVTVIPHGAHVPALPDDETVDETRPTILTWGLLGPGKGIEWGIEALALLRDVRPFPRYLVVGKTHPKVLDAHGESYRRGLGARAERLGISADVEFDATYHDVASLGRIVRGASLVLLPYDSRDQITSGVLIEAVAAGKPVISTRFPHAVELLGGGIGLIVAHRDPVAIADAVRRVLTDSSLRRLMASGAQGVAPSLAWATVADSYRALAAELVARRANALA